MVAKPERDTRLAAIRQERIQEVDDHAATLFELETTHGFDLDAATDVYGLELLEPTDGSILIAKQWQDFFQARQSGARAVVVMQTYPTKRGPEVTHRPSLFDTSLRMTLIDSQMPGEIIYRAATEDGQPSIVLQGARWFVIDRKTGRDQAISWNEGAVPLAQPLSLRFSARASEEAHLANGGIFGQQGHQVETSIGTAKESLDIFALEEKVSHAGLPLGLMHEQLDALFDKESTPQQPSS